MKHLWQKRQPSGGSTTLGMSPSSRIRWALGAVTNLEEKRQIIRRGAMEESWITAGKEVSLWEIARRFHKNRYTVVRVVDERMRPLGTVYEDRILDCILRGEREKTLGELVRSG